VLLIEYLRIKDEQKNDKNRLQFCCYRMTVNNSNRLYFT